LNIETTIAPAIDRDNIWIDQPAMTLVAEFHEAFDHPISQRCIEEVDLATSLCDLRMKLITEEFTELVTAHATMDLVGFIDALQDLKYVIYGAELALGVSGEEHFAEVHAANMRKLGPDGMPIYREDGKVLKPEGWTGPDHEQVLNLVGDRPTIYTTV
jgi:hypothetical protein